MNRNGFTLIEIAVVLAIIAMALMLVIPRLPSTEHENLKTSARTLAATLRYMQERAATMGTPYYLRMEPGTGLVKVQQNAADGSKKNAEDPLLQQKPIKEDIVIADVVIPRLGKLTDGEVSLDAGIGGIRDFAAIHLRSPDGTFWTVMAFPAGGKVKVFQGYQENPL
ncbi:MAG: prepilin-type N-terminal cleavage/methylation domain-containing protein [Deltaproteobacteria bacterium]